LRDRWDGEVQESSFKLGIPSAIRKVDRYTVVSNMYLAKFWEKMLRYKGRLQQPFTKALKNQVAG